MALAELEVETGHVEQARHTFQEALRLCAQNTPKILVAWAKLEEENFGDWEKATELLLRAMEEGGPDFTDATVALAHLEMKKGNKERAVEILKESKHASNGRGGEGGHYGGGSLFNTWASVEAKAGNMDTAIQLLTEATALFPDDFSLLQTLGTLEVKRAHYDRARDCFSRSADLRPHVVTYNAWAIMEERLAHDMKVRVCMGGLVGGWIGVVAWWCTACLDAWVHAGLSILSQIQPNPTKTPPPNQTKPNQTKHHTGSHARGADHARAQALHAGHAGGPVSRPALQRLRADGGAHRELHGRPGSLSDGRGGERVWWMGGVDVYIYVCACVSVHGGLWA
jgi:tetratricopeptide (TPR) repeat protein